MLFNTCTDILGNTLLLPASATHRTRCTVGRRQRGGDTQVQSGGCSYQPDSWARADVNPAVTQGQHTTSSWERAMHECRTLRNTNAPCSACWLKLNGLRLANHFRCPCFNGPLRPHVDVARTKIGNITLLPHLFQLIRARRTFGGMQAKSAGTSAEVLTLKYAAVLFSWSWKRS